MNDNGDSKKTENDTESDVVEQARNLLVLADLVDRYPSVVGTRVTGLIYVLLSGGIAFATLLYTTLSWAFGDLNVVLSSLFAVGLCLIVAWGVTFRLVIPLTKLYNPTEEEEGVSILLKIAWSVFALLMVPLIYFTFGTGNAYLFPPILQVMLATFNLVNVRESRREPNPLQIDRMQIAFIVTILISTLPMLLFPQLGISILILVDIGGIFIQGVHMLISAEKALLQTAGRE